MTRIVKCLAIPALQLSVRCHNADAAAAPIKAGHPVLRYHFWVDCLLFSSILLAGTADYPLESLSVHNSKETLGREWK